MPFQITVVSPNSNSQTVSLKEYPDTCPQCHHALFPLIHISRTLTDAPFASVEVVFQCTRVDCRHLFIGRYSGTSNSTASWILNETVPVTPMETTFGEEITKTSPTFVEVFNQSLAAEAAGLDQLVGMGLRKALEFLVKDFAASVVSGEAEKEQIKKKLLGQCIKDHIKDAAVREAAKRAAWLGNDETHYIRRWETKDITDLKKLVRLTVNAVENALLTAHYAQEMPE